MKRFEQRVSVAVLVGLTAITSAACGSSSSSTSATTAGGSTVSTPAKSATGTPVKISVTAIIGGAESVAEIVTGAEAAAKAINAAGGIKDAAGGAGHPIEIIPCNADITVDPNAPATCATKAVSEGVIADVGKFTTTDTSVPIFANAHIPVVADNPFGTADLTNADVFPFTGGALTAYAGAGVALAKAGDKKIALVSYNVAAAQSLTPLINKVLTGGAKIVKSIYIPLDPSADLSAYIAQATQGTDGILAALNTPQMVKVVTGAQQLGYTGKYGVDAGTVTAAAITQLGSSTPDVYAAGPYWAAGDTSNPSVALFNKEMDALGGSPVKDEFSENAWFGVQVIASTLDKASALTSAALIKGLQGQKIDNPILAPFTLGTASPLGLPRIFNDGVQIQVIKDGSLVPQGSGAFISIAPASAGSGGA